MDLYTYIYIYDIYDIMYIYIWINVDGLQSSGLT